MLFVKLIVRAWLHDNFHTFILKQVIISNVEAYG